MRMLRPPGGFRQRAAAWYPDFGSLHYFAVLAFFLMLTFLVGFLVCSTPAVLAASAAWELWVFMLPAFLFSWAAPVPVVLALSGPGHVTVTMGAAVLVVASFAWALVSPKDGFLRPLVRGERRMWRLGALESVAMAYMAVTALSVVWLLLIYAAGWSPATPVIDWEAEHVVEALFFASVWEEVSVKLTLVSLPLFAAHVFSGKFLPWRRYLLGGEIPMDRLASLLVLVSAGVFAYLHVIGGWDWLKFPPALAFGLFTGYLFLRFGVYASILLHFANNLLFAPLLFSASASVATALAMLFLMFIVLGLLYWLMLVRAVGRTIAGTRRAIASGAGKGAGSHPALGAGRIDNSADPFAVTSARKWERAGGGNGGTQGDPLLARQLALAAADRHFSVQRRGRDPYACAFCGAREYRYSAGSLDCAGCGARQGVGRSEPPSGTRPAAPASGEKDIMEL
jgi:hypothetical protein